MLRAKHLGTLSQSARSFFLSGPRCSAADNGSSCTSCDDENCTSKRPLRANANPFQASSSLLSKTSVRADSSSSRNSGKNADDIKQEIGPASQVLRRTPHSSERSCSVSYGDEIDEREITHSPPPISEHLVKAGMAAVGLFSDFVNNRIPMTEGSALRSPSQNSVVEHAKSVSNVRKSQKSHAKPYAEAEKVPDGARSRGNIPVSARGTSTKASNPELHEKKTPFPHKSSNRFMSKAPQMTQQSEKSFVGGLTRPLREPKAYARQGLRSNHVVESVSAILRDSKWGPSAEEAIIKLNSPLDAYVANQVLKQLKDYNVALDFFYWLKRLPRFKHDDYTYTTMVGILGRAKQFGILKNLLEEMVSDGCKPNIVTYNRLIHSYGKANYLNEALSVLHQMQIVGCEPDRVTYCTLIDIHAKSGYLDIAMEMYHKMLGAGLSPDTFTYSVIINCLGKSGRLDAAHKLFGEMVDRGCVPNLVTYNIMIALHAKARNYQRALQLYRDLQAGGFEPDKVTYSIVMEVLGHSGYLEEAEAVFSEVTRKNWVPDEPVYGLLVDLWGKSGNIDRAWGWYRAMLGAGLCPNVPTCNSLLSAFLRAHRLPDAHNLLEEMLGLGLSPSLQTYTLLLSCCTEARSPLDMAFCGELMTITRHPAHAFLLTMPSPGPDGQNVRDHVSRFLDLMHSEDRESKRGLVDAVVDFFHKTGLKEEAGSVWEVAAGKNIYPDALSRRSSCYWLINLHVMSDGTAVTALSRTLAWLRREMLGSGVCPSRVDIITGWGRRSRVTGTSLVRQAVEDLLSVFGFPFFTENGNTGCFVGCGEPLNRWLLQPCVERMHLL